MGDEANPLKRGECFAEYPLGYFTCNVKKPVPFCPELRLITGYIQSRIVRADRILHGNAPRHHDPMEKNGAG
jgi:hypothetical protein